MLKIVQLKARMLEPKFENVKIIIINGSNIFTSC